MIKDAIAYTSASTALNQKLSVKVNAREPTRALPKIPILPEEVICSTGPATFKSNRTIDQNMNKMVKALDMPDIKFTIKAT